MRLEFCRQLKGQISTTLLPLGIKYSMRDLVSDDNYCSLASFVRYR